MACGCVLVLVLFMTQVMGVEREMTVNIEAGKEECFYEDVAAGNTLTVEYQVIDGGSGQLSELDINFRIVNSQGQPIFAEFKKPDGAHSHRSEVGLTTGQRIWHLTVCCYFVRKLVITRFVLTTSSLISALKLSTLKS